MALVPIPNFDEPVFQLNDKDFAACTQPGMAMPASTSMPYDPQPLSTAAAHKRTESIRVGVRLCASAV